MKQLAPRHTVLPAFKPVAVPDSFCALCCLPCWNHLQGALKLAAQAAEAAGVSDCISFHRGFCGDWQLPRSNASSSSSSSPSQQDPLLVVANPPWGLRLLSGVCPVLRNCLDAQLLSLAAKLQLIQGGVPLLAVSLSKLNMLTRKWCLMIMLRVCCRWQRRLQGAAAAAAGPRRSLRRQQWQQRHAWVAWGCC